MLFWFEDIESEVAYTVTLLVVIIGTMTLTVNNKLLLISIHSETSCCYYFIIVATGLFVMVVWLCHYNYRK